MLNVRDLSCNRGGRAVLAGLGFSLGSGQALLLRGPNGVGKSTLLRALAGLVPCKGDVRLGTIALGDSVWAEQVVYAGHLDAIKPQLSVAENLRFWAGVFGGDADATLDAFDLAPLAGRLAGDCSAGQKRRIGLARLVLAKRRLWLLDEPTTALDTNATALLAKHIEAHCAGGGIAVIATHTNLPLRADTLIMTRVTEQAPDPFLDGAFA